jgi:Aspartyl/Asparaginyl beta-hydroxylase
MNELIKLLSNDFEITDFLNKLDSMPELWRENTWRQDYVVELERPISPQKDTEAVMFRWAPQNTIESVRDSLSIVNHPNLDLIPEVLPIIQKCMNLAGSIECGRVFIAKLKPGGVVIPHSDYGMYSDHFERFHLVLSSDLGNRFYVEDTQGNMTGAFMKPGEFFWFNHKENHWAVNDSQRPRMHLIIDMVSPKYRRERVSIQ